MPNNALRILKYNVVAIFYFDFLLKIKLVVCIQFVKHAICLSAAIYGDVILCFVCFCGLQQKSGCPDKVVTIPTGVLCQ